ncbi:exodeoxyribonuclease-like [Apostichopus japonicus]|uniref:exodeoxyribonuclease-like n=1 Tax=Stichopus japonicus TaxID=307972 RepID=UPI003AB1548B
MQVLQKSRQILAYRSLITQTLNLNLKGEFDRQLKAAFNMPNAKRKSTRTKEDNGESKAKKVKTTSEAESAVAEKVADDSATETNFSPTEKKTSDGRSSNLKLSAWNVGGLRAWMKKDCLSYITQEDADIYILQETKIPNDKVPKEAKVEGYYTYWNASTEKAGYAGLALYSKEKPINVTYGIGVEKHDKEGRVIVAEYEKYYVVGAYIPNSGRKLVRLEYRQEWDTDFLTFIKDLDSKKPVIFCGDLNVAHLEIDLKNPKSNKNKTAGFTDQERDGFTKLLDEGFTDTFRHLYPETEEMYSFWTYMGNCRAKNVGWRLDYFVLSNRLLTNLCESTMRTKVMGSDHCPIICELAM